jgi:hypothetical protein
MDSRSKNEQEKRIINKNEDIRQGQSVLNKYKGRDVHVQRGELRDLTLLDFLRKNDFKSHSPRLRRKLRVISYFPWYCSDASSDKYEAFCRKKANITSLSSSS